MRLKDKVAIVTGGAHGMGEAEVRLFAKEGAAVVIADVLTKEGEAVAADINAVQGRARFMRTDVTSETDWQRLIAETIASLWPARHPGEQRRHQRQRGRRPGRSRGLAEAAGGQRHQRVPRHQAGGRGDDAEDGRRLDRQYLVDHGVRRQRRRAIRAIPHRRARCAIHQGGGVPKYGPSGMRVNSVHPGYMPPMLNATNAAGRAVQDRGRRRCAGWANRSRSPMACCSWRPTRRRSSPERNW